MPKLTSTAPTTQDASLNVTLGAFQNPGVNARALSNAGDSLLELFMPEGSRSSGSSGPGFSGELAKELAAINGFSELDEGTQKGLARDVSKLKSAATQGSKNIRTKQLALTRQWLEVAPPGSEKVIFDTFEKVTGKKFSAFEQDLFADAEGEVLNELDRIRGKAEAANIPTEGRDVDLIHADIVEWERDNQELARAEEQLRLREAQNKLGKDDFIKFLGAQQQALLTTYRNAVDKAMTGLPRVNDRFGSRLDFDAMSSQQKQQIADSLAVVEQEHQRVRQTLTSQFSQRAGLNFTQADIDNMLKPYDMYRQYARDLLSGNITRESFKSVAETVKETQRAELIDRIPNLDLFLENVQIIGPLLDDLGPAGTGVKLQVGRLLSRVVGQSHGGMINDLREMGVTDPDGLKKALDGFVKVIVDPQMTNEAKAQSAELYFSSMINGIREDDPDADKFFQSLVPILADPTLKEHVLNGLRANDNPGAVDKISGMLRRRLNLWQKRYTEEVEQLLDRRFSTGITSQAPPSFFGRGVRTTGTRVQSLIKITDKGPVLNRELVGDLSNEQISEIEEVLSEVNSKLINSLEPTMEAISVWNAWDVERTQRTESETPSEANQ